MNHRDHVALLRTGIGTGGGVWADFGSGTGAFTLALADLLGPSATIYSLDRDGAAMRRQEQTMKARFPVTTVHYLVADYTQRVALPMLDGLIMANTLHFQKDKRSVVELLRTYLRPAGRFVLVEYDTDHGNRWVPFPISFPRWQQLAARCGLHGTQLLARRPSRFLGHIYAAMSTRDGEALA
jgi:SAM-dependent methyltransferase